MTRYFAELLASFVKLNVFHARNFTNLGNLLDAFADGFAEPELWTWPPVTDSFRSFFSF
jgi:hypothetical protein